MYYMFFCKKVGYLTRTLFSSWFYVFFLYNLLSSLVPKCVFPKLSLPSCYLPTCTHAVVCLYGCHPILITAQVTCYQLMSQLLPYCSLHPPNTAKLVWVVWTDLGMFAAPVWQQWSLNCPPGVADTKTGFWVLLVTSPLNPFPVLFSRPLCIIVQNR